MARKRENDARSVERIKADKKRIRGEYSRFPWMEWFRRGLRSKPERIDGVQLEKNDVLAMILAALSLVLPWVIGFGIVFALLIAVLSFVLR